MAELKAAGVNIRLTNNSWGGGGYSQTLKDAMPAVEDFPTLTMGPEIFAPEGSNVNLTATASD